MGLPKLPADIPAVLDRLEQFLKSWARKCVRLFLRARAASPFVKTSKLDLFCSPFMRKSRLGCFCSPLMRRSKLDLLPM